MKICTVALSTILLLCGGCSKDTGLRPPPSNTNSVAVNVHGVNYTEEPFRYVVIDPENPLNSAGGEHIEPFSGGGIMCCYKLPKQWNPGLHVKIEATHWLAEEKNGNIPEVSREYMVNVPKYLGDHVPEVWVLRTHVGGIELVLSDVEPSHPQWPGSVKGWPKPSLTYWRAKWEQQREQVEGSVKNYKKLLHDLSQEPKEAAEEAWDIAVKYKKKEIKKFGGPGDPAYAEYLRERYKSGLKSAEARLGQLMREKPK